MKKTLSILAALGVASLSLACSGDDGPTPLPGGTGGSTSNGTGGTGSGTGTGGGDATGTGGGDTGTGGMDVPSDFVTAGLGESGSWKGYLFTAAEEDSMITPEAFTTATICASGTLGADYEQWAMIGWNIAQVIDEDGMGGAVESITPTATGVKYEVQNNGTSGLRIQIQDDEAGTNAWCADVKTPSGTIPWADLKKECWLGTMAGAAFDPSSDKLAQVAVQTYAGSDKSETLFDYCVVHLGPAE